MIESLCMSKATNFVDLRMASSFSLGIGLWVNFVFPKITPDNRNREEVFHIPVNT